MPQPVEQFVTVGGGQNFADRVGAVQFARSGGDGQKMQVVVAEQNGPAPARQIEVSDAAQRLQGAGAAVDDVADKNKTGVFAEHVEKFVEAFQTALKIADGVNGLGHRGCIG